ncbi:hypothetical protein LPB19_03540 [Marinobacter salinisoli]|uniref:Uncharacterized protein n=1 Tax=Marinobacter salinisoli TaxID=2769486 RepID=A0ABX7MT63_9GAMM|nr:hypothetical protein [Marinobacter salinisoli]QSP95503.1 hypothetical protein LPB19_03540 [Marinobacter salinisoli]
MNEYEHISYNYRFGKVYREFWGQHIKNSIEAILVHLKDEHDIEVEGIYLENYRSPEPIIVVNGNLPIAELKRKFSSDSSLSFTDSKVVSSDPWVTIEGQGD